MDANRGTTMELRIVDGARAGEERPPERLTPGSVGIAPGWALTNSSPPPVRRRA